jgi:hypothetical protein
MRTERFSSAHATRGRPSLEDKPPTRSSSSSAAVPPQKAKGGRKNSAAVESEPPAFSKSTKKRKASSPSPSPSSSSSPSASSSASSSPTPSSLEPESGPSSTLVSVKLPSYGQGRKNGTGLKALAVLRHRPKGANGQWAPVLEGQKVCVDSRCGKVAQLSFITNVCYPRFQFVMKSVDKSTGKEQVLETPKPITGPIARGPQTNEGNYLVRLLFPPSSSSLLPRSELNRFFLLFAELALFGEGVTLSEWVITIRLTMTSRAHCIEITLSMGKDENKLDTIVTVQTFEFWTSNDTHTEEWRRQRPLSSSTSSSSSSKSKSRK